MRPPVRSFLLLLHWDAPAVATLMGCCLGSWCCEPCAARSLPACLIQPCVFLLPYACNAGLFACNFATFQRPISPGEPFRPSWETPALDLQLGPLAASDPSSKEHQRSPECRSYLFPQHAVVADRTASAPVSKQPCSKRKLSRTHQPQPACHVMC